MPITFPRLDEAEKKLAAKQKELHDILAQAGPDLDMSKVTSISGDSKAKVDHIRKLNDELDDLGGEVDDLRDLAKAAARAQSGDPSGEPADQGKQRPGSPGHADFKGIGHLFVQSDAFKRYAGGQGPASELQISVKELLSGAKATFRTDDGWAPEVTRTGRVVPAATRPIQVIDLIPTNTTDQAAVLYMEETVFQNTAAETAEGDQFPEGRLKLEERDSPVRDITVWLPVTDNQLADENQARGYIENRLPFMCRQRLDGQILVGSGTAPNLRGLNNVIGRLTQARGSDPTPDAFYKAMTKVMVEGRAVVDSFIMNPLDWQLVRLLRTADGIYIWGSPSETVPDRMWGRNVAQSDAQPLGSGLAVDTSFTELTTRQAVEVQISNAHADFFIRGKQAVRAKMRVAFTVYRPAAVCSVTGLPAQ